MNSSSFPTSLTSSLLSSLPTNRRAFSDSFIYNNNILVSSNLPITVSTTLPTIQSDVSLDLLSFDCSNNHFPSPSPSSSPLSLNNISSSIIPKSDKQPVSFTYSIYVYYVYYIPYIISMLYHITLIGVFETIFFFNFISVSEDTGLENSLESYITGIISTCNKWPANITGIINDILLIFINTTDIYRDANSEKVYRYSYNNGLEMKAWMYVLSLACLSLFITGISKWFRINIHLKKLIVENIAMVFLLGLYEYMFFSTIIYNYKNISQAEMNLMILNKLQNTCHILQ